MFSPMLLWEKRQRLNRVASRDANVFHQSVVCAHYNKVSAPFTYYFESFSNIVFVSSSVSGLIVTYFRGVSTLAEKNVGQYGRSRSL